jgi:hypothetical protein
MSESEEVYGAAPALTPEEEAERKRQEDLRLVDEATAIPAVSHAMGLLLASWQLYYLAREQMMNVSGGLITEDRFPIISQALARSACDGFKVGKLKNRMKRVVMPFLQLVASSEIGGKNGKRK